MGSELRVLLFSFPVEHRLTENPLAATDCNRKVVAAGCPTLNYDQERLLLDED